MDLTGWTGTLHLSNAGRDEPPFLSREAYFIDTSTGTLAFSLAPEDTSVAAGDYVYEIRIDSSSDSRTVVYDRLKILDSLV